MTKIPYEELQVIAERYSCSHVIMLAYEPGENREYVVTWGKSVIESDQAARFGNEMKTKLGWPESLHTESAKVIALIEENRQLKALIARWQITLKAALKTLLTVFNHDGSDF